LLSNCHPKPIAFAIGRLDVHGHTWFAMVLFFLLQPSAKSQWFMPPALYSILAGIFPAPSGAFSYQAKRKRVVGLPASDTLTLWVGVVHLTYGI